MCRSIQLCIDFVTEDCQLLAAMSKRSPLLTKLCTTRACSRLGILLFFRRPLTFAQSEPARSFRLLMSAFAPLHTPRIRMSPAVSLLNTSFSALLMLFCSWKLAMVSFMVSVPLAISLLSPIGWCRRQKETDSPRFAVEALLCSDQEKRTVFASLLKHFLF